jgi:Tfp pilus assembly protein PilZ
LASSRQEQRLTINKEFDSFDQFIQEYVTNISQSGVFIRTEQPLAIGTEVDLRFSVIMDNIETVEGVGVVVRVQQNPSGMGVVFKELTSYSEGLVRKLLTQHGVATDSE